MGKRSRRLAARMPENSPVCFGIIGCGSASIPVCEAMVTSPLTQLAAVYDVNQDLASDLAQRFHVHSADTLAELLADPAVEAIYIAVPHYLLAPLTRQVLEANKHALTEKPLAISLEEIDRLKTLATERQLRLGVFYEMRYAPAYGLAREWVQAGAIGEIIGVQIQTLIDKPLSYWQSGYSGRSINPWRGIKAQAGGGVVLMNTSHLLDALFYVTGLSVTRVSAEVSHLVANVEVEDTTTASLRFSNGALGSLIAGAHIHGAYQDESLYLYGTKGQMYLPDPYGSDPLQIYVKETWMDFKAEQWQSVSLEPVSVYREAIEDFAQAITSRQTPPIDAEAARHVLAVVLSMYQSAALEKAIPVSS